MVGTLLEIVKVVASKDLALHCFDPRLAPISAYRLYIIGGHIHFKRSVPFNRLSSKLVGTLPEMVRTVVPEDFTQYCSSPPLCTII